MKLYDLLGYRYSAVSPSPGALILLQAANILPTSKDPVQCRGRIRGVGFNGKRISVQEVRASRGEDIFDGVIVSISHDLSIYGRTVVLPDLGAKSPRHIDGMKRVDFTPDRMVYDVEVYADNQVEGRSLVSPAFAKGLVGLAERFETKQASVAFAGRQMHVALPTGKRLQFSGRRDFSDHDAAADQIAQDISRLFDLIARVDAIHASADRHYPANRDAARREYYLTKIQSVKPMVTTAMSAGIVTDSRRAKYLAREAAITNPELNGMILSGA